MWIHWEKRAGSQVLGRYVNISGSPENAYWALESIWAQL